MFNINIFNPSPALAQNDWEARCVSDGVATIQGFECLFLRIVQPIATIAGFVFLIMFIVGGFKYLTSAGDPKKASSATSTLTMAIIGLVGIIISWIILFFIQEFTGVSVTKFVIPDPS